MQLRARQRESVERSVERLNERGNTLLIAPTGAGKTVVMGAVHKEIHTTGDTHLIIQHRDELVTQNRGVFGKIWPEAVTVEINKHNHSWFPGGVHFGMVQTVARMVEAMPRIDMLTIDEAHHAAAPGYIKIIETARNRNPALKIFGATATAARGDRKALRTVWDNVADRMTVGELVEAGFLVQPRVFLPDTKHDEEMAGVRAKLEDVKKIGDDFDMHRVAAIMNTVATNESILKLWLDKAKARRTVIFCATVDHAQAIMEKFKEAGVVADMVWGDMPAGDRARVLASFDAGRTQVITNVMVLTEGWDCQPVDCIVLARPCGHEGLFVQMCGRGLRKVDPERYPDVVKDDCLILDFGWSADKYFKKEFTFDVSENIKGRGIVICPNEVCRVELPKGLKECPLCGTELPQPLPPDERAAEAPAGGPKIPPLFEAERLRELKIFDDSPYRWERMFDGLVMVANGLDAWATVVSYNKRFHAIGGGREIGMHYLANAHKRDEALASADDFLREHGDPDKSTKTRRWLEDPASEKQRELLRLPQGSHVGLSKYQASCWLTWQKCERGIRARVEASGSH